MRLYFKNVRTLFEHVEKSHKDSIAFTVKLAEDTYREISFGELAEEIRALAAYLTEKGYKPGDKVGVIGVNCYEWAVVFYGTMYAGLVSVPMDNRLFPEEIERLIERSHAKGFFYTRNHRNTMAKFEGIESHCMNGEEAKDGFLKVIAEGKALLEKDRSLCERNPIDENALGILMFTSGTTAESKGVMLSQRNLLSNTVDLCEILDFKGLIYAALIPFHHSFGVGAMTLFMATGVKTVFPEGLRIAKCLNEYKVSLLVGVPAIFNAVRKTIFKAVEEKGKTKTVQFGLKLTKFLRKFGIDIRKKVFAEIHESLGGNLKVMISGASALDPEISDFFNGIGIDMIQGYGLTETAPVLSAERPGQLKRGSIGYAMHDVTLDIAGKDEKGIGEIIAKGPNVMLGYYENEEATREVLKDGWFYTGDMGYMDKDGYVFITGRKKNVIVLNNGKNVFPEELEQLLDALDGVNESLVYVKEEGGKERLFAKIVYDKDLFDSEEKAYAAIEPQIKKVNETLVDYKQIRDFHVTDKAMEKTTTAKVKRNVELAKL